MSTDRDGLADRRRTEVLNAAEKLLAVHGYEALRLRDVSQAAGLSIGLIQHYFGTRDELLLETMSVASRRRVDQWSQLTSNHRSSDQRLWALIKGAVGDRHRCVIWIETCAAATRHAAIRPDVLATQHAWLSTLTSAIRDGVEDGTLPAVSSPAKTAELLVRVIDGFILAAAVEDADTVDQSTRAKRTELLEEAVAQIVGSPAPSPT